MQTSTAGTLPQGIHRGTITGSEIGSFPWRSSPDNPHGLSVKVRVEVAGDDGVVRLDDAADVTNPGRVAAIFRAAGLPAPHGDIAPHLERLVGRQVDLLTRNITVREGRNAGRERAVVSSWLPPT